MARIPDAHISHASSTTDTKPDTAMSGAVTTITNGHEPDDITEADVRPPRINNACVACRRRKTKCSGGSAPCEACSRSRTYCFYNPRLDSRRKVAYKPGVVQEHQRHILRGLLQTLKYGNNTHLSSLLTLLREEAPLDQVAESLCDNFEALRTRQLLPATNADNFDVVSLVLSDLEKHRVRWPTQRAMPQDLDTAPTNEDDLVGSRSEDSEEPRSAFPSSSSTATSSYTSSSQPYEPKSSPKASDRRTSVAELDMTRPPANWNQVPSATASFAVPIQAHERPVFCGPQKALELCDEFQVHARDGNVWPMVPQYSNMTLEPQLPLQTAHFPLNSDDTSQRQFPVMPSYNGNFAQY